MLSWLKRALGVCIPSEGTTQPPTHSPAGQACVQGGGASAAVAAQDTPGDSPAVVQGGLATHAAGAADAASRELTPPMQMLPGSQLDAHGSQHSRYIMSDGVPVGIANTVSKYKETQPVVEHLTPFEERVARKLTEEQRVAAALAAAGAGGGGTGTAGSCAGGCTTPADAHSGDGGGGGSHIKQQLFTSSDGSAEARP